MSNSHWGHTAARLMMQVCVVFRGCVQVVERGERVQARERALAERHAESMLTHGQAGCCVHSVPALFVSSHLRHASNTSLLLSPLVAWR